MSEHTANIKYIRASAKKIRFLVDDVKNKKPAEVIDWLYYNPSRSAFFLRKVIKSAVDGAVATGKADKDVLKFKEILIDQGPVLKRFRAGAKGMAKPYRRPSTHIKVVLFWQDDKQNIKKEEKKAPQKQIKNLENKKQKK